jgi:hypothetical protein
MALAQEPCVKTYCRGAHAEALPQRLLEHLPEHVILDHHLPLILEDLDEDAEPGVVEETEGVSYMPEVSFSHVGMPFFCNEWEVCASCVDCSLWLLT